MTCRYTISCSAQRLEADKLAYSPKASVVDQDGQVVQLSNHSLDLSDTTLLGQVGGQDCTAHARL
jgi:hypothetical protein